MSDAVAQTDALLALGRPERARQVLLEALAQQPEDFNLLVRLAQAESDLGNPEEALRVAGLASAADPESFCPHEIRANAFLAQGKIRAAVAAAEEALRLDPGALVALEVLALHRRDLAAAREAAQVLLVFSPESSAAHRAMGRVYERSSDHAEAEKHYREALRLEPESVLMMMHLGWFLIRHKQRPEGAALLHLAARTDPANNAARQLFGGVVPPKPDEPELAAWGPFFTLLGFGFLVFGDGWLRVLGGVMLLLMLINIAFLFRRRSFRLTPEAEKFLERIEEARKRR